MVLVVIVAIPVGALPIGALPLPTAPIVASPVGALPVVSRPLVVVPVGAAPIGLSPVAVACRLVHRGDGRPHDGAFDCPFHWAAVPHLAGREGVSQGWCGRRGHQQCHRNRSFGHGLSAVAPSPCWLLTPRR